MVSKYTVVVAVVVLAALVAVIHAAAPRAHQLTHDYSFEQYLQDHPRVNENFSLKADSFEYNNRKAIFETNLKEIIAHNAKNLSWKMGVNDFTAMTTEEFLKKHTGERMSAEQMAPLQQKTRKIRSALTVGAPVSDALVARASYPDVDWSARGFMVREVRAQGSCGSCYAHSSLATLEFYLKAKAGKEISLAPQQPVDCFENPKHCGGTGGCHGYTAAHVMQEYARDVGIVRESDYPYFSGTTQEKGECQMGKKDIKPVVKTTGAERLTPNDVNAFMEQLQRGVIAVSVDATPWKGYESGILMNTTRGYDAEHKAYIVNTNHAVTLVGVGQSAEGLGFWKVRNSWGPSWGNSGHIYLYRPINGEPEQVYINLTPESGSACDGDSLEPFYVAGSSGILSNGWIPTGVQYLP